MSDPVTEYWEIEPGAGVGPVRLGTVRAELRSRFNGSPVVTDLAGGRSIDHHGDLGVRIYYAADVCAGAELFGPVAPLLHGEPLLGRSRPSVAASLRRVDADLVVGADGLTSFALGLALWVPSAGRRADAVVESVLVRRPGRRPLEPQRPPAGSVLVLVPELPFAVVDEVVRGLGLRGGPTTALAPLVPGEPEAAAWEREGTEVTYAFDPITFLRTVSIRGAPAAMRAALADRLPNLDEPAVTDLLFARDDEALARGVQAARALGLTVLAPRVEQLRHTGSPVVAGLADQAAADLQLPAWP